MAPATESAFGRLVAHGRVPADWADGEVLVGGFPINDGTLVRAAAIGGGILVVAGSIGNVLMTILINLLNELTGGLRHTVIKEPVRRPQPVRRAAASSDNLYRSGPPGL